MSHTEAMGDASTAPASPPSLAPRALPHECSSAFESLRAWITTLLLGKNGTDGFAGRLAVLEREHALAVQSFQKDLHDVRSDMREIRSDVARQAATSQRLEQKMDDVIRYVREGKVPAEFLWFVGGCAGVATVALSFSRLVPLLGWWMSASAITTASVVAYLFYLRQQRARHGVKS